MSVNVALLMPPWLYAGVDDAGWAMDEINGGGVNEYVFIDLINAAHLTTPFIWNATLAFECTTFSVKCDKIEFSVAPSKFEFCVRA